MLKFSEADGTCWTPMEPFRVTGTADKGVRTSLPFVFMPPLLIVPLAFIVWSARSVRAWFVFWLAITAVMVVFELLFVRRYLTARRPKTLQIDDTGVRLLADEKPLWDLAWGEISAVRTTFPGSHSFTGFVIWAGERSYRVDNTEQLGPRIKLVEAYRVLAGEAKKRNIRTRDLRGWSAIQMSPAEKDKGRDAFDRLEGIWIENTGATRIDQNLLKAGLALLTTGMAIFSAVYLLSGPDYFNILGGMLIFLGCFILVLAFAVWMDTVAAIKFDDGTFSVRLANKKEALMQWADILQVRINPGGTYLGIMPKGGLGWYGHFAEEAGLAVKARYVEEYEKHYDVVTSHEISRDGMDIGFQDGRKEHFAWKDIGGISPKGSDPFVIEIRNTPVLRLSQLDRETAVGISDSYDEYKARALIGNPPKTQIPG